RRGRGPQRERVRLDAEPRRLPRPRAGHRGRDRRPRGHLRLPPRARPRPASGAGRDPRTNYPGGLTLDETLVSILRRHLRYLEPDRELAPDMPLKPLGLD